MKFWLPEAKTPRRAPLRPRVARRLLIAFAAFGAAGYVLAFHSGLFAVRDVRFSGAGFIPRDTLASIEAGLRGANLLTLSAPRVERRFRAFPEVRRVVLVRHLSGTLECVVARREPVALMACGDLVEVDGEGVALPKRSGRAEVDLPIITGIDERTIKRTEGKRRVRSALEVLSIFKELGFSPTDRISEIHVDGEDVDLVWMGTGTLVKLGRGAYADRIRTLRTICGAFNDSERVPDVIDLRFDRQVVIR